MLDATAKTRVALLFLGAAMTGVLGPLAKKGGVSQLTTAFTPSFAVYYHTLTLERQTCNTDVALCTIDKDT